MMEYQQPQEIPGWTHVYSGKVRELYVPEESRLRATGGAISDDAEYRAGSVLILASDRISAFDHVLPTQIPDKGIILTQLSLWWFAQMPDIPHHVLTTNVHESVRGRAVICKNLSMLPVENIVRGYLAGSGFASYSADGAVSGVDLPGGLRESHRLDPPIFTPTAKAELGEHDEPITFQELADVVGHAMADRLRELSLRIYTQAQRIAHDRGMIVADTKMEYGLDSYRGAITLGDELLTPDSSRFWDRDAYTPGRPQDSFDKQYMRDWLRSKESGWNGTGPLPPLPDHVVRATRDRYVEVYERLTGEPFSAEGPFFDIAGTAEY